ncbi:hypothetical protein [Paracoccus kondratievae]|uniref:Uncharacterized protein n=1 Tax=Paracoccus kondratievae TaxID=135740 RepID=A0AAD3P059_9RHOB|nr:hypothetical protein [Paracoccus kondratievae]GLK65215.1 hypothetical protein GCM10017635_26890 [Paracoccus kondratievae]
MVRQGVWLAGFVAFCAAPAALAQGLVITPLPPGEVIRAAEAPVTEPVETPVSPTAMPVAMATQPDVPQRTGLPRPSIIVGDMAVLAGFDPRSPIGLPLATRETIRQRDRALFDRLLGRGAFDPDTDRLAEAIQTELQRMDCYTGSIDGDWGAGSIRAVGRWSEAADSPADNEPEVPLFRAIVGKDGVRCVSAPAPTPAPAVARGTGQPRTAGAAGSAPRRATAGNAATPRANAARPAAPAAQPQSPRINMTVTGSGMYR